MALFFSLAAIIVMAFICICQEGIDFGCVSLDFSVRLSVLVFVISPKLSNMNICVHNEAIPLPSNILEDPPGATFCGDPLLLIFQNDEAGLP